MNATASFPAQVLIWHVHIMSGTAVAMLARTAVQAHELYVCAKWSARAVHFSYGNNLAV